VENIARLEDEVDDSEVQKIVDRVKKLLALSTSNNEHESAAALGQAQALMLKYSIDAARLNPDQKLMETDINSGKKFQQWELKLAGVVAHFNGCVLFYSGIKGRGETKYLRFYGKRADLIAARYMHGFILSEMNTLAEAMGGDRTFRASYREGLVDGVAASLQKAKTKVYNDLNQENREMGIVKIEEDTRVQDARNLIEEATGSKLVTRKHESKARDNATARAMGEAHGKMINPNRNAGGLEKPNEQLED